MKVFAIICIVMAGIGILSDLIKLCTCIGKNDKAHTHPIVTGFLLAVGIVVLCGVSVIPLGVIGIVIAGIKIILSIIALILTITDEYEIVELHICPVRDILLLIISIMLVTI